jgi:DNA polymerase III subunit beta
MRVEAKKSELLPVVKRALAFVERKTTIPILANLKLDAARARGVTVTGTDLETSLSASLDAAVKAEGTITVPARKLADTLAKLKTIEAERVVIAVGENNWVNLSCGPLTVKLVGMASTNYPVLPKPAKGAAQVVLPGAVLAGLIRRVQHAASTTESRYTLNGVLLSVSPKMVRAVATDGHIMGIAEHDGEFRGEFNCLIGIDTIGKLSPLLGDEPLIVTLDAAETPGHVFVEGVRWSLAARLLTGTFPNWQAVIPTGPKASKIILPGAALRASLDRVAGFADERSRAIKWEMIPDTGLRLSASSCETGEASETVAAQCGAAMTVGLSASYVGQILGTLEKDQAVTLAVRDAMSGTLWTPAESNGFRTNFVLMPMRI